MSGYMRLFEYLTRVSIHCYSLKSYFIVRTFKTASVMVFLKINGLTHAAHNRNYKWLHLPRVIRSLLFLSRGGRKSETCYLVLHGMLCTRSNVRQEKVELRLSAWGRNVSLTKVALRDAKTFPRTERQTHSR